MMSTVTARMGDRWDIPASEVSFWVNEAYQQVANMSDHDPLEKIKFASITSLDDRRLLLPADYNEPAVLSVVSFDSEQSKTRFSGNTLELVSIQEMDNLDSTQTGEPEKYAIYGRWIELFPSIDSAYSLQLRYKEYPEEITECSDVPGVSPPWRWAIVLKAEQLLEELIGNDEGAAKANNNFVSYVNSLNSDKAKRQKDDSYNQGVRVVGWQKPRRKRRGTGRVSDPDFDKC
jgi:hypothetical protein